MDYNKIGNFIAQKRKNKNLTQKNLAKQLNITDKAVSKWERGLGCPDVSVLENLSKILDVSILDLLNGEEIDNSKINVDNTEIYIKNTIDYSKKEINHWQKICSGILVSLILFIGTLLILLNGINIFKLNKKFNYDYDSYCGDISYLDNSTKKIKDNIAKIRNNQGIYNNEDYISILNDLDKLENYILNLNIFRYAKDKKYITINDVFVFNNDIVDNDIGINIFFKLYNYDDNLVKEYTNMMGSANILKNELVERNYQFLEKNYLYSVKLNPFVSSTGITDNKILIYGISYNDEILNNISTCMCAYRYNFDFYEYLTSVIIKVGDINE